MNVVLAGTAFTGATAVDFGVGITVNSFSVDSDIQITADITIALWAPVGPHNVTVTTPFGTALLAGGFTVFAKTSGTSAGPKTQGWGGGMYGAGGFVGNLSGWEQLVVTRRVNAPDRIEVLLDGRHSAIPYFATDTIVQIYRANVPLGIAPYKEAEGFCRVMRHEWDEHAHYMFRATLLGYEDLLDRRILLGGDDEPYAAASYPAETVMKKVVSVQCGVSGTRKLITTAVSGLAIDTSLDRGLPYNGYDPGQKLLEYLQDVADARDMAFRVVIDGEPGHFRFKAWPNPFGADRTATGVVAGRNSAGNIPVVFSEQRRNISQGAFTYTRDGEGNTAVDMDASLVTTAAGATDSLWNACEFSYSAGSGEASDVTALRELAKMAAREETDIEVIQMPACAYGKHYFLGDLVTVYIAAAGVRKSLTKVITEVTITTRRQAGQLDEQVKVVLADRPVQFKGPVEEALMNLSSRVGKLERR